MKELAIVSGGLDSVTLAYKLAAEGRLGEVLSFDYGQRHAKELGYAAMAADALDVPHAVLDVPTWGGSALTKDAKPVPDGHYAEETMRDTVVPNRNAIMLSLATGVAVDKGYDAVGYAVHSGDHYIYPDCRPQFVQALSKALQLGTEGFSKPGFHIDAPFVYISKADIVGIGDKVGVPFADTWSCYKGGDIHCGSCGTCFERREAFVVAGVDDPTEYEATPDYAAPEGVGA